MRPRTTSLVVRGRTIRLSDCRGMAVSAAMAVESAECLFDSEDELVGLGPSGLDEDVADFA